MFKLEISEVHEKKVIMRSVIQLMTHFTGNNFFGAITNIPANVPEALQLVPIMMLVQSLEEMR